MTRYAVSVTILATITVDASDKQTAINEARRFAESLGDTGGYVDGWNSVAAAGAPTIADVSGFDIEDITGADVEKVGVCRSEDCDNDPDNGDGFDGYCGTCADKREA